MKKKPYPLEKVYRLLEPGPVVLLTTASKGKQNLMPMSWLTMIEFTPTIIACTFMIAGRKIHLRSKAA